MYPQPNPPVWPSSVVEFTENDIPFIEDTVSRVTGVGTDWDLHDYHGHFSDKRIALLFHPGTYPVNVQVGYYCQVLGLGEQVTDVRFTGRQSTEERDSNPRGVYCRAADPQGAGSLDTFWRAAENFTNANDMRWAVSQAAPLRRVRVEGNLHFFDFGDDVRCNNASGGFCANLDVTGEIAFGSQQQFMVRNCSMAKGTCSVWNFVFVGCDGAPVSKARTITDQTAVYNRASTPVHAEKPFITCSTNKIEGDAIKKWALHVPFVRQNSRGVDHSAADGASSTASIYSFEHVFVARETNTTSELQHALDMGLHILFSPGNYLLSRPLKVARHNQVLLGIGMASLIAASNHETGCIIVESRTHGVRIAGLTLQANHGNRNLLLWGSESVPFDGNPLNPGVISDLFVRVGGPDIDRTVSVQCMVKICSSHIIGDNLWLWRADHALLAPGEVPRILPWRQEPEKYHLVEHTPTLVEYECFTGLEVRGSYVTIYGLAVEHTTKDQTLWFGEHGEVYFYQCELPYDVETSNYECHTGYRVHESVTSHLAVGVGVYSYFRDHTCKVKTAMIGPSNDMFINPFTVRLEAHNGILSVLNHQGPGPTDGDLNGKVYFLQGTSSSL